MRTREGYTDLAAVADVPVRPPFLRVKVGGQTLILLRTPDGTVHAVDATCPHMGGSLVKARLEGTVLECPRHCYAYDLAEAGRCVQPGDPRDFPLRVHEVRVRDGRVQLRTRAGRPVPVTISPQR